MRKNYWLSLPAFEQRLGGKWREEGGGEISKRRWLCFSLWWRRRCRTPQNTWINPSFFCVFAVTYKAKLPHDLTNLFTANFKKTLFSLKQRFWWPFVIVKAGLNRLSLPFWDNQQQLHVSHGWIGSSGYLSGRTVRSMYSISLLNMACKLCSPCAF